MGNKTCNLKTGVGHSYTKNGYDEDFIKDDYSISKNYTDNYIVKKWLFNSTLNYKFSNRLHLRAGAIADLIHLIITSYRPNMKESHYRKGSIRREILQRSSYLHKASINLPMILRSMWDCITCISP